MTYVNQGQYISFRWTGNATLYRSRNLFNPRYVRKPYAYDTEVTDCLGATKYVCTRYTSFRLVTRLASQTLTLFAAVFMLYIEVGASIWQRLVLQGRVGLVRISRFDSECQSSPSPCFSPSNSEEILYTSCNSEDDLCLVTPTSIHDSQVRHVLHPILLQCSYTTFVSC